MWSAIKAHRAGTALLAAAALAGTTTCTSAAAVPVDTGQDGAHGEAAASLARRDVGRFRATAADRAPRAPDGSISDATASSSDIVPRVQIAVLLGLLYVGFLALWRFAPGFRSSGRLTMGGPAGTMGPRHAPPITSAASDRHRSVLPSAGKTHGGGAVGQLARFCTVGASGYVVNLSTFAFAIAVVGLHHLMAATAAFLLAVANNFYWNRRWTFSARDRAIGPQGARFLAVSVIGFLAAATLLEVLVAIAGLPPLIAQVIAIACGTPLTFMANRRWTFTMPTDATRGDASPEHLESFGRRPSVWLVLPTYCEAENIEQFVRAVVNQLASCAGDPHVLVVDDSSPDGTGDIADRLAGEMDAVEVLHRPAKDGLGPAYLAGFRRALGGEADLVLEMDSDFSHDPRDLPRLIEAADRADLVLGSRYVREGGVANWSLSRRLVSRCGCWYARMALGVRVRDLTGGFKCFRREVLERLDLDRVRADGYAFQVELTYRALRAGFRVREVPILFRDRRAGTSKMNVRIAGEAIWKVPALRLKPPAVLPPVGPTEAARAGPVLPQTVTEHHRDLQHFGAPKVRGT